MKCLTISNLFEKFYVHYVPIPHAEKEPWKWNYEKISITKCLKTFEHEDELKGKNSMFCEGCS
jgi:hypothetical protein